MARHTKEWNEGYQAAIEAIKNAMQGGGSGSGAGQSEGLPSDMTPPPSPGESGSGSGKSGSGSGKSGSGSGKSGSGSDSNSRTSSSDPNQGIVRPEDCSGSEGVSGMPSTPGGFFSKEDGDKLAEKEGYDKDGGSAEQLERNWADTAVKTASQMKGDKAGNLKSTLEGMYKTKTDWKGALRKIVGRSINPEDKRQAYANKNILVAQDRIARTDKDKYDNMDYMMAWIDSSGSMSDEQLKMCLSEVYAVAIAKKPMKIVIVQCDTKIHQIKEYRTPQELKKDIIHQQVLGRGGTELKPCWDLLKTDKRYKGRIPDLIMIFTDGWLNQYKRDRKTMSNLVWCFIDNPSKNVEFPDAMTKCIHLSSKDIK
jgi:hypothetical protein